MKVETGTGGVDATFAVGTVKTVVRSVVVTLVINLLNTSAIRKKPTSTC
jgi:hypothetical protein